MKDLIFKETDILREELVKLSKDIHQTPELAFEEYKSVEFIIELLKKHGFTIEEKIGKMDTAFRGRFKVGSGGPVVAYLAEYDALPEIGHACGHNLIAATSVGAAIALSKVMSEKNIAGEVILLGTPAEEGGGGKILLLNEGEFDGVEYVLMTHPSGYNMINRGGLATTKVTVTYHGVAAHSAAAENGVNALQGVIQTFNLIDSIRARMPNKTNINGIITAGGSATNIIPDYAQCKFSVRNATFGDLKIVVSMIKDVVNNIEGLLGVRGEFETSLVYSERYCNLAIDERWKQYMEEQGETVLYPDPDAKIGSSDIGNVTLKVPAIHAYVKITDEKIPAHNAAFTEISATDQAHTATIKAVKALAATGLDIMVDESFRAEINKEFKEKVPHYDNFEL